MNAQLSKIRHFVKTVSLSLSLYDVVSGRAAQALAQSPFASLVFEAVRKVRINFDSASALASMPCKYNPDTAQSLYEQLARLFPFTRTALVTQCRMYTYVPVATNCAFAQVIAQFHDTYRYAEISSTWDMRLFKKAQETRPALTKINMFCRHNVELIPTLIRQCANSLEHLNLKFYEYINNDNIFEDKNGKAVAYYNLKSLKLMLMPNTSGSRHHVSSPAIFLPRLTHLTMIGNYPFKDAVLFQSVSKTLEWVRISTTLSLLDIINRYSVFSDICCANTKHISIFSNWDRFYVEKYNSYYMFLSIVSRRIVSLKVHNAYVTDIFMDLVMQVPELENIQSLNIDGTVLSFNSLCSLIESLPRMTRLRFQSIEVYEDYDIPDAVDLYEHIISKRAVLSSCLQFCQVIHHDPLDCTNDLAICGILLSVICPRFTRLVICDTARSRYDAFIKKAIEQEPFSRYAERLCRLMFND
ncbi:hypothetical protein GGI20_001257 [Coemansia sp. BCRC 34301]|nr:hypothetical protein GGI20_001257 [Coemansia sp. BCRC 34301]